MSMDFHILDFTEEETEEGLRKAFSQEPRPDFIFFDSRADKPPNPIQ